MDNKRTKTKKVVKRRLRWQGVFFLASICAVFFFLFQAAMQVEIKTVKVSGNEYVKDAQIIKNAGFNESVKYFGFKSKKVCEDVVSDPLIKSCKIKRGLGFQIEIVVEENIPLFFYSSESSIVLSDKSFVDGTNLYGLPTLINFVPEDVFSEFVDRLADIDGDIIRSIGEIEYTPTTSANGTYIDKERFIMDMNDGNTVIINNRNMSILNRYKKIYASIDKLGVYNFDCDYDNYIFTEYGE